MLAVLRGFETDDAQSGPDWNQARLRPEGLDWRIDFPGRDR
jgi:hypothetical protein